MFYRSTTAFDSLFFKLLGTLPSTCDNLKESGMPPNALSRSRDWVSEGKINGDFEVERR